MNKPLVIDNFFGDPDLVRQIALNATYYTKDNHPGNIGHFPGYRTDYFNEWNQDLYQAMLGAQIQCAEQLLGHKLGDKFKEYWTKFSFSWTDKDVILQDGQKIVYDSLNGSKYVFNFDYGDPAFIKNMGDFDFNLFYQKRGFVKHEDYAFDNAHLRFTPRLYEIKNGVIKDVTKSKLIFQCNENHGGDSYGRDMLMMKTTKIKTSMTKMRSPTRNTPIQLINK
jgi:hypothetical protein